jgi:uncharacterized damage-inducible protein DinB
MAALIPIFKKELEQESVTTRKIFERIPQDKFDWKPHPKSMDIQRLATHIAEMMGWIAMAVTSSGIDFGTGAYQPKMIHEKQKLLEFLDDMIELADSHLRPEFESKLSEDWLMRSGDTVLRKYNRAEVIRLALNQVTHHRAQLGVYLRLLDIPIPGSYGPSADEG